MAEINLLPWRATLRNAVKKEFLIMVVVVLGLAIFILAMSLSMVKTKVQQQQALNTELKQNMAILEPKLVAIAAIKIELNNLSTKRDALEQLQLQRSGVVHLLEQVVYQMPPGVYLTHFDKKGMQLIFEGVAESNSRVSEFMQKIEEAKWIAEPHLTEIKVVDGKEENRGYHFKMTARCLSLRANAKQPRKMLNIEKERYVSKD